MRRNTRKWPWALLLCALLAMGWAAVAGAQNEMDLHFIGSSFTWSNDELTFPGPASLTLFHTPGSMWPLNRIVVDTSNGPVDMTIQAGAGMTFDAGSLPVLEITGGHPLTLTLEGPVTMASGTTVIQTGSPLTITSASSSHVMTVTSTAGGGIGMNCGAGLTLTNEANVRVGGQNPFAIGVWAGALSMGDNSTLDSTGELVGVDVIATAALSGYARLRSTGTGSALYTDPYGFICDALEVSGRANAYGNTGNGRGVGLFANTIRAWDEGAATGVAGAMPTAGTGGRGLHCTGALAVAGSGSVSGQAYGADSWGINCTGPVTIVGGTLTGYAAAANSWGFHGTGTLAVSGIAGVVGQAAGANSTGLRNTGAVTLRDDAQVLGTADNATGLGLNLPSVTLYGTAPRLFALRRTGSETHTVHRDPGTTGAFTLDVAAALAPGYALTDEQVQVVFSAAPGGAWVSVDQSGPPPPPPPPPTPTLAQEALNTLTVSGVPALNAPIAFTAAGDRQDAAGVVVGDTRWQPFDWSVNPSGVFPAGGPYTATFTLDTPGDHTLTVRFREERWDGAAWGATGGISRRQQTFTLAAEPGTTPAPGATVPPTGDSGQMGLYLALLCAALGVWALARRRKTA